MLVFVPLTLPLSLSSSLFSSLPLQSPQSLQWRWDLVLSQQVKGQPHPLVDSPHASLLTMIAKRKKHRKVMCVCVCCFYWSKIGGNSKFLYDGIICVHVQCTCNYYLSKLTYTCMFMYYFCLAFIIPSVHMTWHLHVSCDLTAHAHTCSNEVQSGVILPSFPHY